MNKNMLIDYVDACELLRETEEEIQKARRRRESVISDLVAGIIEKGISGSNKEKLKEKILEERKAGAVRTMIEVEAWMNKIPSRMQRIVRYKIFKEMTWREVAVRIGRNATAESVKKEFQRFMDSN